jgi:hypothetical protein
LTRKATGGSRKTTRGRPTAQPIPGARENRGKSSGGVDLYGHTKEELRKRAAELDGRGRSTMTKEQVADAIARKQANKHGRQARPASTAGKHGRQARPASTAGKHGRQAGGLDRAAGLDATE